MLALLVPLITAAFLTGSDVLQFPAPDPLIFASGKRVVTAEQWTQLRRLEILNQFYSVYGTTPSARITPRYEVTSTQRDALNGKAVRKEITISFGREQGPKIHVLLYLPAASAHPVPVFVGLNFSGNQTVATDPGTSLPQVWNVDPTDTQTIKELRRHIRHTAPPSSRGQYAYRWQVENILNHGYGIATAYYGDIEPDFNGGLRYGVRALFLQPSNSSVAPNEWGALGAWAWGLSRIADYLQSDPDVDGHRLAVVGHSRLGKATLWAAAQDARFRLVISNESGVGGASLYRAKSGETIEHLNTAFPYWFCENFHQYTGHPNLVPVDGNLLLALLAPRSLYVASAEGDTNSNPAAEFLSLRLASPVYELLGQSALGKTQVMPVLNTPLLSKTVGYHERSGPHEVTAYDWEQYLSFADSHLGKR